MNKQELIGQIKKNRSFLCVGLDTDIRKLPEHLLLQENPMLEFNKAIIEATAPYCVAYKPNTAFYESMGAFGMKVLEDTIVYIKEKYPEHFVIADAKRGDIGNTGNLYARAFFEYFKADALTIAPYMGEDSVKPFLSYPEKWVILLALTSNAGAQDFQLSECEDNELLFEKVIKKSMEWGSPEQMMYVVGATQTKYLQRVRSLAKDYFLLVPGIGTQGGNFAQLIHSAITPECGLIVNASRSIIYADSSEDFARAAANEAKKMQLQMEQALKEYHII